MPIGQGGFIMDKIMAAYGEVQDLLLAARVKELEFLELCEAEGVPRVYVNSTDHERALPSGEYYVVTSKTVPECWSASSRGVRVGEEEISLEEWDDEAVLVRID
jgi:hypothetical protein